MFLRVQVLGDGLNILKGIQGRRKGGLRGVAEGAAVLENFGVVERVEYDCDLMPIECDTLSIVHVEFLEVLMRNVGDPGWQWDGIAMSRQDEVMREVVASGGPGSPSWRKVSLYALCVRAVKSGPELRKDKPNR